MVTIENKKSGVSYQMGNEQIDLILTALLHEMERYNKVLDIVTDENVIAACDVAKTRVYNVHRLFCEMLSDPEI